MEEKYTSTKRGIEGAGQYAYVMCTVPDQHRLPYLLIKLNF